MAQVEDQQSLLEAQEVLVVAENAERKPGTEPGEQHDPGTYDKTHQAARRREPLSRNASIERTRQTSPDSRTEAGELDNSLGEGKPLVEGKSSEIDGIGSAADDVFAGTWSGKLGRELCGMVEALGKNTVMNEQVRYSTAGPAGPFDQNSRDWCSLRQVHTNEERQS